MADIAFQAVKGVLSFIREEARLQGRAGDDVRFIMDEMESMNNLLHQLVLMNKSNSNDPAGSGDYCHLRTWMKQLMELAFDSRNCVELYMQPSGGRFCWLPWAILARHRVVSQIRELRERAREISDRQMRYGGSLMPHLSQDGRAADTGSRSTVCNQRQKRAHAGSSTPIRRAILDGEFVDNSSVDEALSRLYILLKPKPKPKVQPQQPPPDGSYSDDSDDFDDDFDDFDDSDDDEEEEPPPPVQSDGSDKPKPTQLKSDVSDKPQQSDDSDKQQQKPPTDDSDKPQPQSDAGLMQQQQKPPTDDSDKQLQSDAGLMQQQQQKPPMDDSDKQLQLDGTRKPQPTQSVGGDKQPLKLEAGGDKQQQKPQSDESDKQAQRVTTSANKEQQQRPQMGDSGNKGQQFQDPQLQLQQRKGELLQRQGELLQRQGELLQRMGQPQLQLEKQEWKKRLLEKKEMDKLEKELQKLKPEIQKLNLEEKQEGEKKKRQLEMDKKKIKVVPIYLEDGMDEAAVGEIVLERYKWWMQRTTTNHTLIREMNKVVMMNMNWKFGGRAVHVPVRRPPILSEIKVHIANQAKKQQPNMSRLGPLPFPYYPGTSQAVPVVWDGHEIQDEKQAEEFMTEKSGKEPGNLLLVLSGLCCHGVLDDVKEFLCNTGWSGRSAILLCTNDETAAEICSYPAATEIEPLIKYSLLKIYLEKAVALLPSRWHEDGHVEDDGRVQLPPKNSLKDQCISPVVRDILKECSPDEDCMKMFLHALYYYPDMTREELERLRERLGTDHQEKQDRIITFCYEALPNDYKNCLWYSAVFTRGINTPGVRRATLVRRWIAQGLIKEDEAKHCFDAMLEQKLILSRHDSGTRKVKSCEVHTLVDDLIKKESPTVEDLLLNNQLPIDNLDLLYSIRNAMQLHPANSSITSFLNSISNSRLQLTVLDLEGRNNLKPKDLRSICKMHKLKYLSLRNTDATYLPRQIDQLENLETLDIRGTNVQAFHMVLPKLKHLLAGRIIPHQDKNHINSKGETFSTVCMPRAVETMEKLEVLSRVKVTNSAKDLIHIGDKRHLKKLGVVLSGKKASLKDLFLQIDKLDGCLRSLSIRMEPPGNWDAGEVILLRPPKLMESLHICSIRRGLPPRIKELGHLAKITLQDTFLTQEDLCVLGTLPQLRYLRLFYHSFAEGNITIGDSRTMPLIDPENCTFKNLRGLAIEDDNITSITLSRLPKLQMMTWSFSYMESLSGVQNLQGLTHLVLNGGSYNEKGLNELKRDIQRSCNRNGIAFTCTPPQRGEESRVADRVP